MPPPAQGQQGQEDSSTNLVWGVAALFVFVGLGWYLYKEQIILSYLTLKIWELKALRLVVHTTAIDDLIRLINETNPARIEFQDLMSMGQMVGTYLRIPLTILLVVLAVVVYFGNTVRKFKNIYSMKMIAQAEQVNWPQISPVVNLNLVQTDIDVGPWAMGLTPMQFCKKHNLVEFVRRPREEGTSRKDAGRLEVILKRGESNKVFALQLGPRWEGVERLPPYARALFAVFAARLNADTQAAAKIVAQLNRSCLHKLDYSGVDVLLKKHLSTKLVQQMVQGHAYVLTVMAAILAASRVDGVQATADFLWLKPLDRRLWYVLNTMGRQTPWSESAGAYAHLLAEREAGRKLIVPMVEAATNALELAIKSIAFKQDDEG